MGYWVYNPVCNNWYFRFNATAATTPDNMDWEPTTPPAPPAAPVADPPPAPRKHPRSFDDDDDLPPCKRRRLDF